MERNFEHGPVCGSVENENGNQAVEVKHGDFIVADDGTMFISAGSKFNPCHYALVAVYPTSENRIGQGDVVFPDDLLLHIYTAKVRHATEEEKKDFLISLEEANLEWDFAYRYLAYDFDKSGNVAYYIINSLGNVARLTGKMPWSSVKGLMSKGFIFTDKDLAEECAAKIRDVINEYRNK